MDAMVVDRYQLDLISQEGAVRRAEVIGWQYPCYENSHWHVSGRLRMEGHTSLSLCLLSCACVTCNFNGELG